MKDKYITFIVVIVLAAAIVWAMLGAKGINGPVVDYNKIAIPSEGINMDSPLSKYFGRAQYFIVYDVKKDAFWTLTSPFYGEKHAVGLRVGAMLVKKGVGIAVAQNIGPEPCKYFTNNKIKVYIGAQGTVRDAVRQYQEGSLILTTKPNVPTHYGVPNTKPCPNVPGQPTARIAPKDMGMPVGGAVAAAWNTAPSEYYSEICPFCLNEFIIPMVYMAKSLSGEFVCPYCSNRMASAKRGRPTEAVLR